MDDRLDIRQRRALATSYSYPDSDSASPDIINNHSAQISCSPFPTLTSRWRARRMNAQLPLRLGMRLVEIALMALAMFLLPSLIQYFVRSLDELYEVVGRRARSPFAGITGSKVLVGTLVFVICHVVLVRLGYVAFVGDEGGEEKDKASEGILRTDAGMQRRGTRAPWSRILGRILLPSYLVLALLLYFYRVASSLLWPTFAAANTAGEQGAAAPPSTKSTS
ncbi:hypothetical protein K458DRAFT_424403 [Lentithecium fluviatile CBS 122367]|uniref:Uncharacterized protein n=1 Tax=Lentithecium fluviatile CBS 122367 TaxID=1168545 RepID=A0A6G1IG83_9PLEO|nr:hypothetical protein K458DRAFT_424403 [Lentithecium fluviatile CBS 122367]